MANDEIRAEYCVSKKYVVETLQQSVKGMGKRQEPRQLEEKSRLTTTIKTNNFACFQIYLKKNFCYRLSRCVI